MRVRGLDSNHDWLFGKGKSDYRVDINGLEQNIQTRIMSFLGDCFFDQNQGIDWWNLLGSKRILDLRLAIAAIILNTANVQTMAELTVSLGTDRKLTIQYSVVSVYGEISRSFSFDPSGVINA